MRPLTCLALGVAAIALSAPGHAHDTGAPHTEPPGWTFDPWIVVPLIATLALFWTGWRRLHRRSRLRSGWRRPAALFTAGWIVLATALLSPLHQAGERSFAAHMLEHEIIMLLAAPLLVLSRPLAIMLWAFPKAARRRIGRAANSRAIRGTWRAASGAVTTTLLQAAALWIWHAPALFDRALADEGWHATQHLTFLITALLFWSAMLGRHTPAGVATLCLIVTSIVSGALGALMAFATSPWYAGYARLGLSPYGLTPAEDQQIAGLLMWVPGGLVHAGAALLVLRRVLKEAS
ncbi:cytochrome c oxidase assembly protein [Sphingomonas aliaeris]|uniref:Cytochrome c oxidase assembly protein n=1 Tax=Sphingomonas aliaeris TaxID=2759526 RepID=A0A974NTM3_9SPHN|nr:cytochrome c oxidase assembly protein [Sphingomonas aliaeris]QQV76697.1 cytochrome c oxidase assembly protein [Sphingomonas aliaeris]